MQTIFLKIHTTQNLKQLHHNGVGLVWLGIRLGLALVQCCTLYGNATHTRQLHTATRLALAF